jgi:hypothetical protein
MDPNEQGRERKAPSTDLDESIKARLPRAAPPPPLQKPDQSLEDTSPHKTSRKAVPRSRTNDQVIAGLYVLTILVLFFVMIRYIISVNLDHDTLIYFGLPLLAIGYLAREVLARLTGDASGAPPRKGSLKPDS